MTNNTTHEKNTSLLALLQFETKKSVDPLTLRSTETSIVGFCSEVLKL